MEIVCNLNLGPKLMQLKRQIISFMVLTIFMLSTLTSVGSTLGLLGPPESNDVTSPDLKPQVDVSYRPEIVLSDPFPLYPSETDFITFYALVQPALVAGVETASVFLKYSADNATWHGKKMERVTQAGDNHTAQLGTFPLGTTLAYYVEAWNQVGGYSRTETRFVRVVDTTQPLIKQVKHSPLDPDPSENIIVTATVISRSISKVFVSYRTSSVSSYVKVAMYFNNQEGHYEVSIGSFAAGETIYYHITANTTTGQYSRYPSDEEIIMGEELKIVIFDSGKPVITNVTMVPKVPNNMEEITIYANITDNGLSQGKKIYPSIMFSTNKGNNYVTRLMIPTVGEEDTYEVNLGVMASGTEVWYYIRCFDSDGNTAYYPAAPPQTPRQFKVKDTKSPIVYWVSHLPTSPTPEEYVWVNVTVVDQFALSTINLFYRSTNEVVWQSVGMNPNPRTPHYTAMIERYDEGEEVEYFIQVADDNNPTVRSPVFAPNPQELNAVGEKHTYVYRYTVRDVTNPVITMDPTVYQAAYNETEHVQISATITDNIDVYSVALHYNYSNTWYSVAMNETSPDNWFTDLGSFPVNALVNYFIVAKDQIGNTKYYPDGLTTLPATPVGWSSTYDTYVHIQDEEGPIISSVRHVPLLPKQGEVITISALVTDNSRLFQSEHYFNYADYINVTLMYRVRDDGLPDGGPFISKDMLLDSTGTKFVTTIGGFDGNSIIDFRVNTSDIDGNIKYSPTTGSSFYTLLVEETPHDSVGPYIGNPRYAPETIGKGDNVTFWVESADNLWLNNNTNVSLYYRAEGATEFQNKIMFRMTNTTFMNNVTFTTNLTSSELTPGILEWYINATDGVNFRTAPWTDPDATTPPETLYRLFVHPSSLLVLTNQTRLPYPLERGKSYDFYVNAFDNIWVSNADSDPWYNSKKDNVTLYYRIGTSDDWSNKNATLVDAELGLYRVTLNIDEVIQEYANAHALYAEEVEEETFYWYFRAADNATNERFLPDAGSNHPFHTRILDKTNPVIQGISFTPKTTTESYYQNDWFKASVDVTDNVEVAWVNFLYSIDGGLVWSLAAMRSTGGQTYEVEIGPKPNLIFNYSVHFKIIAYDIAGNTEMVEGDLANYLNLYQFDEYYPLAYNLTYPSGFWQTTDTITLSVNAIDDYYISSVWVNIEKYNPNQGTRSENFNFARPNEGSTLWTLSLNVEDHFEPGDRLRFAVYVQDSENPWYTYSTTRSGGIYFENYVVDSTNPTVNDYYHRNEYGSVEIRPENEIRFETYTNEVVNYAKLVYRVDGGVEHERLMVRAPWDQYHWRLDRDSANNDDVFFCGGLPEGTLVEYKVMVEDFFGNTFTTDYKSFTVDRFSNHAAPTYGAIYRSPVIPTGGSFSTGLYVVDEYEVSEVNLTYRVNGGTWNPLTIYEGSDAAVNVSGTITGLEGDDWVEYYFSVSDNDLYTTTTPHYHVTHTDTTNPVIDVSAQLDILENETAQITITFTESNLWKVWIHHRVQPSQYWYWDEVSDAGQGYVFSLPRYRAGSVVEYYATVIDNHGNYQSSVVKSYEVGEIEAPILQKAYHNPLIPTPGSLDFYITAGDQHGLSTVSFYYKINGGSWLLDQKTAACVRCEYEYHWQLNGLADGDRIEYYFTATDLVGNSVREPVSPDVFVAKVAAEDVEDPVIHSSTPTYSTTIDSLTATEIVAQVTDDVEVGVVFLKFSIDGGVTTHQQKMVPTGVSDQFKGLLGTFPFGTVITYSVVALDKVGNQAEFTGDPIHVSEQGESPLIGTVVISPHNATQLDVINVSVPITASSYEVHKAVLHYQINGTDWHHIHMDGPDNSDLYTATLGRYRPGTNINFYVEASTNLALTSTTHQYNFTVAESPTRPIIDSVHISDTTLTPTDSVIVSAVVLKDKFDIGRVVANYTTNNWADSSLVEMFSNGSHYVVDLGTFPNTTTVKVFVTATDLWDNNHTDTTQLTTTIYWARPSIINLSAIGGLYETLQINATYVAAYTNHEIFRFTLFFRKSGQTSWVTQQMDQLSGNLYTKELGTFEGGTVVEYFVRVVDEQTQSFNSTVHTHTVAGEVGGLDLYNGTSNAEFAYHTDLAGGNIIFRVYNGTLLSNVSLVYSTNAFSTNTTLNMTYEGANSWNASISTPTNGTMIHYVFLGNYSLPLNSTLTFPYPHYNFTTLDKMFIALMRNGVDEINHPVTSVITYQRSSNPKTLYFNVSVDTSLTVSFLHLYYRRVGTSTWYSTYQTGTKALYQFQLSTSINYRDSYVYYVRVSTNAEVIFYPSNSEYFSTIVRSFALTTHPDIVLKGVEPGNGGYYSFYLKAATYPAYGGSTRVYAYDYETNAYISNYFISSGTGSVSQGYTNTAFRNRTISVYGYYTDDRGITFHTSTNLDTRFVFTSTYNADNSTPALQRYGTSSATYSRTGSITFSVDYYDPLGTSAVYVAYSYDGSSFNELSLTRYGSYASRSVSFSDMSQEVLYYYFRHRDSLGNNEYFPSQGTLEVRLLDKTTPYIDGYYDNLRNGTTQTTSLRLTGHTYDGDLVSDIELVYIRYTLDGISYHKRSLVTPLSGYYYRYMPGPFPNVWNQFDWSVTSVDSYGHSATENSIGSNTYDYTPPQVFNITFTSSNGGRVEPGDDITVTWNASDILSDVQYCYLYYGYYERGGYNGNWAIYVGSKDEFSGLYQATISNVGAGRTYRFFIYARDYSGNTYSTRDPASAYYSFSVNDNTDPTVTAASLADTSPSNIPYFSTSSISDEESRIPFVVLDYSIDSWATTHSRVMNPSDPYWYSRDTFPNASTVKYRIRAYNENMTSHSTTEEHSFTVHRDDNEAPRIHSLSVNPKVPTDIQTITINVNATDNTALDTVKLEYDVHDEGITVVDMTPLAEDLWQVTIGPFNLTHPSQIQYRVIATDLSNNNYELPWMLLHIKDTDLPYFVEEPHITSLPLWDTQDVVINTTAYDHVDIHSAVLYYRLNGESTLFKRMNMLREGVAGAEVPGNTWWSLNLGRFEVGTTFEYFVRVFDRDGNTIESSLKSYYVSDDTSPTIGAVSYLANNHTEHSSLTFKARVYDNFNMSEVWIRYSRDNATYTNLTLNRLSQDPDNEDYYIYQATTAETFMAGDIVYYQLYAEDGAGNTASGSEQTSMVFHYDSNPYEEVNHSSGDLHWWMDIHSPVVYNISYTQGFWQPGTNIEFSAHALDDYGINTVKLYFLVDNINYDAGTRTRTTVFERVMTPPTDDSNLWTLSQPVDDLFVEGDRVRFWLIAYDFFGNTNDTRIDQANPHYFENYVADKTAPMFTSVTTDPSTVRPDSDVKFTVVTPERMTYVKLHYQVNSGSWHYRMLTESESSRNTWTTGVDSAGDQHILFGSFPEDTVVNYKVEAEDYQGNVGTSSPCQFVVQPLANTAPVVASMYRNPIIPGAPSFETGVRAADDHGITNITLWYNVNKGALSSVTLYTGQDAAVNVSGTISGLVAGDWVDYYFTITDDQGAVTRLPTAGNYSTTVDDTSDAWVVSVVRDPSGTVAEDQTVNLTVTVDDTGDHYHRAWVHYRTEWSTAWTWLEVEGLNATLDSGTVSLPRYKAGTTVTYYATVIDEQGNKQASGTSSFTVQSVEAPVLHSAYHYPLIPTGSTIDLYLNASDQHGLSQVTVHYQINGGTWSSTAQSALCLYCEKQYQYQINSLSDGDVVNYYFTATDTSGNEAREPAGTEVFTATVRAEDTTLPSISGVTSSVGATASIFAAPTISATVTDNIQVGLVSLIFSTNGGVTNYTQRMLPTGGDVYQGNLGTFDPGTTVTYWVKAVDSSGNTRISSSGTVSLSDVGPGPTISSVTVVPTDPPNPYDLINITASVTANSYPVYRAVLFYSIDGTYWQSVPMDDLGSSSYKAVLGRFPASTTVDYYINASNTLGGSSQTSAASFTITNPVLAPTINNVVVTSNPTPATPVEVTALVTENYVDIARVVANYSLDGGSTWFPVELFLNGTHYTGSLGTFANDTDVQIQVSVADAWGNLATYGSTINRNVAWNAPSVSVQSATGGLYSSLIVTTTYTPAGMTDVLYYTIYFKDSGTSSWTYQRMLHQSGQTYSASLGTFEAGTTVDYFVSVVDVNGQTYNTSTNSAVINNENLGSLVLYNGTSNTQHQFVEDMAEGWILSVYNRSNTGSVEARYSPDGFVTLEVVPLHYVGNNRWEAVMTVPTDNQFYEYKFVADGTTTYPAGASDEFTAVFRKNAKNTVFPVQELVRWHRTPLSVEFNLTLNNVEPLGTVSLYYNLRGSNGAYQAELSSNDQAFYQFNLNNLGVEYRQVYQYYIELFYESGQIVRWPATGTFETVVNSSTLNSLPDIMITSFTPNINGFYQFTYTSELQSAYGGTNYLLLVDAETNETLYGPTTLSSSQSISSDGFRGRKVAFYYYTVDQHGNTLIANSGWNYRWVFSSTYSQESSINAIYDQNVYTYDSRWYHVRLTAHSYDAKGLQQVKLVYTYDLSTYQTSTSGSSTAQFDLYKNFVNQTQEVVYYYFVHLDGSGQTERYPTSGYLRYHLLDGTNPDSNTYQTYLEYESPTHTAVARFNGTSTDDSDGSGVAVSYLHYSYDGSSYHRIPVPLDSNHAYNLVPGPLPSPTFDSFSYYVTHLDQFGNNFTTAVATESVDLTAPRIFNVTVQTSGAGTIDPGDSLTIRFNVSDRSNLENIWVSWRYYQNSWSEFSNYGATFDGTNNDWYAIIDNSADGGAYYEFYVYVRDASDNIINTYETAGAVYGFTVTDNNNPTVGISGLGDVAPEDYQQFSIDVSDSEYRTQYVLLHFSVDGGVSTKTRVMDQLDANNFVYNSENFPNGTTVSYWYEVFDANLTRSQVTGPNTFSSYEADTVGPQINSYSISPDAPSDTETITFTVNATDNIATQAVYLNYNLSNGVSAEVMMTALGNNIFQATIGPFNLTFNSTMTYAYCPLDMAGNWNNGSSHVLHIRDTNLPYFIGVPYITNLPTKAGQVVEVSTTVADHEEIHSVVLFYRINGTELNYSAIRMLRAGTSTYPGNGSWSVILDQYVTGLNFTYFVEAYDREGNVITSETQSHRFLDSVEPYISRTEYRATNLTNGNFTMTFTAWVFDNSEVDQVWVQYYSDNYPLGTLTNMTLERKSSDPNSPDYLQYVGTAPEEFNTTVRYQVFANDTTPHEVSIGFRQCNPLSSINTSHFITNEHGQLWLYANFRNPVPLQYVRVYWYVRHQEPYNPTGSFTLTNYSLMHQLDSPYNYYVNLGTFPAYSEVYYYFEVLDANYQKITTPTYYETVQDPYKPQFYEMFTSPTVPTTGEPFIDFFTKVRDNHNETTRLEVYLNYSIYNSSTDSYEDWVNVRMDYENNTLLDLLEAFNHWSDMNSSGDLFMYRLDTSDLVTYDRVKWYVNASDGPNWERLPSTDSLFYELEIANDTTGPVIVKAFHTPFLPAPDQRVTFSVITTDSSAIEPNDVKLHYSVNGGAYTTLTMLWAGDDKFPKYYDPDYDPITNHSTNEFLWSYEINLDSLGIGPDDQVVYYVTVQSIDGQLTKSSDYRFRVSTDDHPYIGYVNATPVRTNNVSEIVIDVLAGNNWYLRNHTPILHYRFVGDGGNSLAQGPWLNKTMEVVDVADNHNHFDPLTLNSRIYRTNISISEPGVIDGFKEANGSRYETEPWMYEGRWFDYYVTLEDVYGRRDIAPRPSDGDEFDPDRTFRYNLLDVSAPSVGEPQIYRIDPVPTDQLGTDLPYIRNNYYAFSVELNDTAGVDTAKMWYNLIYNTTRKMTDPLTTTTTPNVWTNGSYTLIPEIQSRYNHYKSGTYPLKDGDTSVMQTFVADNYFTMAGTSGIRIKVGIQDELGIFYSNYILKAQFFEISGSTAVAHSIPLTYDLANLPSFRASQVKDYYRYSDISFDWPDTLELRFEANHKYGLRIDLINPDDPVDNRIHPSTIVHLLTRTDNPLLSGYIAKYDASLTNSFVITEESSDVDLVLWSNVYSAEMLGNLPHNAIIDYQLNITDYNGLLQSYRSEWLVNDRIAPDLHAIEPSPKHPTSFENLTFVGFVADNVKLKKVTLRYTVWNQGNDATVIWDNYTDARMDQIGETGKYQTIVESIDSINSTAWYQVIAEDIYGQKHTSIIYTLRIMDAEPPEIIQVQVNPPTPEITESTRFGLEVQLRDNIGVWEEGGQVFWRYSVDEGQHWKLVSFHQLSTLLDSEIWGIPEFGGLDMEYISTRVNHTSINSTQTALRQMFVAGKTFDFTDDNTLKILVGPNLNGLAGAFDDLLLSARFLEVNTTDNTIIGQVNSTSWSRPIGELPEVRNASRHEAYTDIEFVWDEPRPELIAGHTYILEIAPSHLNDLYNGAEIYVLLRNDNPVTSGGLVDVDAGIVEDRSTNFDILVWEKTARIGPYPVLTDVRYTIEAIDGDGNGVIDPSQGYLNFTIPDNYAPEVSTVIRSPEIPVEDAPVRIILYSADNVEVASATLLYQIEGEDEVFRNVMEHNIGTGTYEASIPGYPDGTVVTYSVEVKDQLGNKTVHPCPSCGEFYSYEVQYSDGPVVANPFVDPILQKVEDTWRVEPNKNIEVGATITDDYGIAAAWVVMSKVGEPDWKYKWFELPQATEEYRLQALSQLREGDSFDFYYFVIDTHGHSVNETNGGKFYHIYVPDLTDPVIHDVVMTPGESDTAPNQTSKVMLRANVTDNFGVELVQVYYRSQGSEAWKNLKFSQMADGDSRYEVQMPTCVPNTVVEYYLMAYDEEGNFARYPEVNTEYLSYECKDAMVPYLPVEPWVNDTSPYSGSSVRFFVPIPDDVNVSLVELRILVNDEPYSEWITVPNHNGSYFLDQLASGFANTNYTYEIQVTLQNGEKAVFGPFLGFIIKDTVAPTVETLANGIPDSFYDDETVEIKVRVTDNSGQEGVSRVQLAYNTSMNKIWTREDMRHLGNGIYTIILNNKSTLQTTRRIKTNSILEVAICAVDKDSNSNACPVPFGKDTDLINYEPHFIKVLDRTTPTIWMADPETEGVGGQEYPIEFSAYDNNEIDVATLHYTWNDPTNPWKQLVLSNASEAKEVVGGEYVPSGTMQYLNSLALPKNVSKLYFYIEVSDPSGNNATSPIENAKNNPFEVVVIQNQGLDSYYWVGMAGATIGLFATVGVAYISRGAFFSLFSSLRRRRI